MTLETDDELQGPVGPDEVTPMAGAGVSWVVDGLPVPQGSLRAFMAGGRPVITYTAREPLAVWRDAVRDGCPILEPSMGPWSVAVTFRMKRPSGHRGARGQLLPRFDEARPTNRPDIDKLARAVLDALTMRVWRDDAQVVQLCARKEYADTPGAVIEVWRA